MGKTGCTCKMCEFHRSAEETKPKTIPVLPGQITITEALEDVA